MPVAGGGLTARGWGMLLAVEGACFSLAGRSVYCGLVPNGDGVVASGYSPSVLQGVMNRKVPAGLALRGLCLSCFSLLRVVVVGERLVEWLVVRLGL